MVTSKLTKEDIEEIKKQLQQGKTTTELAKKYNVHQSTIQKRCKDVLKANAHPPEIRVRVLKKIKEGYTKAEAGMIYGVSPHTVLSWAKGMPGYKYAGDHIIRKHGIELLNRLLRDGYLISDFNVPVVRNLQHKFPIIRSARYKDKTFFYLEGREEETIEAFFREKPDRVISYRAIEEMAYLLGVKISKKNQWNLLEKYKRKHAKYWRSRRLIQRRLEDFYSEDELFEKEWAEPTFRLMPKQGEW